MSGIALGDGIIEDECHTGSRSWAQVSRTEKPNWEGRVSGQEKAEIEERAALARTV